MAVRAQGTTMSCNCCKSVNAICFWGPRREAAWKRPVLLVCSLVLAFGVGALGLYATSRPDGLTFVVLAFFVVLLGIAGLLVSIAGCDACVARVLGEA